jgi:hypothetical protein
VPLATQPVATAVAATITARYDGQARSANLIVQPPGLDALNLELAAVLGGEMTTATVTLSGPAPAGGAMVALSSSDPFLSMLPAAVFIPAGMNSAVFSVGTARPVNWTSVTLSASLNGSVRSTNLTVGTFSALLLRIRFEEVLGGTPNLGILTLVGPALDAPLEIALSSNNPGVVVVPGGVTLMPGQKVVTFPVETRPVGSREVADITASWSNGAAMSVRTVVLPPELLTVPIAPTAIVGGGIATGSFTFTGPVPATGILVQLASESPVASVPEQVLVPPGATTFTFPIMTSAVTQTQAVTIAATFGGRTRRGTLVVKGTEQEKE